MYLEDFSLVYQEDFSSSKPSHRATSNNVNERSGNSNERSNINNSNSNYINHQFDNNRGLQHYNSNKSSENTLMLMDSFSNPDTNVDNEDEKFYSLSDLEYSAKSITENEEQTDNNNINNNNNNNTYNLFDSKLIVDSVNDVTRNTGTAFSLDYPLAVSYKIENNRVPTPYSLNSSPTNLNVSMFKDFSLLPNVTNDALTTTTSMNSIHSDNHSITSSSYSTASLNIDNDIFDYRNNTTSNITLSSLAEKNTIYPETVTTSTYNSDGTTANENYSNNNGQFNYVKQPRQARYNNAGTTSHHPRKSKRRSNAGAEDDDGDSINGLSKKVSDSRLSAHGLADVLQLDSPEEALKRERHILDIFENELHYPLGYKTWVRDTTKEYREELILKLHARVRERYPHYEYSCSTLETIIRRATYYMMQSRLRRERRAKAKVQKSTK
ncbi:hypothetical protein Kpol_292p5 [Vanderwaltozyma polyspora DSM 70294]|uniref:Uncharacterized protein n=1 Tax=Vanderwaltozyma polyspora (strain ATCC 22028 / DSM 70294 / BCRC 21397 / CBS 2163 / NBRC 10782 / NRRL Y-8283 / UCD 57-17) TaxID=436907 RepID=A7TT48_VANPO|nr:uncharacterized protein Kpol_292p5 [Vanderwaltozyma polyspora DSM 70294]EDO14563.1 hypothetical protein Kpol_292p5 [Vanderwaltozyma polyspora DSM 70294]